jgi:ferredoxin-NADP reductase
MAMLRHRAARGSDLDARLLVSVRSEADRLYAAELERLEPRAGLRVERTYTRAAPDGWTGWARRVDAEMVEALSPGPADRPRVFVCGPTGFVESAAELLVESGIEPRTIHAERFGPTGD